MTSVEMGWNAKQYPAAVIDQLDWSTHSDSHARMKDFYVDSLASKKRGIRISA